jgi:SAM-dependent methyltransferase
MADLRFFIDRCDSIGIFGWADDGGPVDSIDLHLNGLWVASLSPNAYRPDLKEAGLGDGRRAFQFPLAGRLKPGLNVAVLSRDGVRFFERQILVVPSIDNPVAHPVSQIRWRGDESAAGLTWGRLMTGDPLWNLYEKYRRFTTNDSLLEIGPGYGRLLKTAIERKIPFASYTGLDLSEVRIDRLRKEFTIENIQFVFGDIDTWIGNTPFEVVLSSATFEHLHPDCRAALRNVHGHLADHGQVFIDFIGVDSTMSYFESSGTYIRVYPREELAAIFRECRYTVHAIEMCTIGQGASGPVDRFVVVAEKG